MVFILFTLLLGFKRDILFIFFILFSMAVSNWSPCWFGILVGVALILTHFHPMSTELFCSKTQLCVLHSQEGLQTFFYTLSVPYGMRRLPASFSIFLTVSFLAAWISGGLDFLGLWKWRVTSIATMLPKVMTNVSDAAKKSFFFVCSTIIMRGGGGIL